MRVLDGVLENFLGVMFKDVYVKLFIFVLIYKSVIGMVRIIKNVIITLVSDIEKIYFP